MEVQSRLTQILGDVLGDLILSHLQSFAQLDYHLIALVPAEQGQGSHQGGAGGVPDHHPLRHLDQVGKVGGDMENMTVNTMFHLVPKQFHSGHLDDPGGRNFQVIQKHLAGDIGMVQRLLQPGHVPARPAEDAALEKDGGQLAGGGVRSEAGNAGHLGMGAGDVAHRLPEELEGGGDQLGVVRHGIVGGEVHQLLSGIHPVVLGRKIPGGVQKGEGGVRVGLGWVVIIAEQGV